MARGCARFLAVLKTAGLQVFPGTGMHRLAQRAEARFDGRLGAERAESRHGLNDRQRIPDA